MTDLTSPQASDPTTLYRAFATDGALLYVGMSGNVMARIEQHRVNSPWWARTSEVTFEHHPTRAEAAQAEASAIKAEAPLFNIVHQVRPPYEFCIEYPIGLFAGDHVHSFDPVLATHATTLRADAEFMAAAAYGTQAGHIAAAVRRVRAVYPDGSPLLDAWFANNRHCPNASCPECGGRNVESARKSNWRWVLQCESGHIWEHKGKGHR